MILIEVASEAGMKVGGIYTVLSSKSKEVVKRFGDNYFMVGMYDEKSFNEECEIDEIPEYLIPVFEKLNSMKIKAYFCRWKAANNTQLISIDAREFGNKYEENDRITNKIKDKLWHEFKIDSLHSDQMFDNNITWAWAAGILIKEITKLERFRNEKVVAHFHEWISAAGLLYLKIKKEKINTVFTTHATVMGRSMSTAGLEIFDMMKKTKNMDQHLQYNYKREAEHQIEQKCAENADVFTAVSEIVGKEAEWVLGKKPDIITENAINLERFENEKEIMEIKKQAKKEIDFLIKAAFEPYYPMGEYLTVFLASRYEVRDKGIDIFLEALKKANELIEENQKSIIAFICTPTRTDGPRRELERNHAIYQEIAEISERIFGKIISKEEAGTLKTKSQKERLAADEIFRLYQNMRTTGENTPTNAFILSYPNDQIFKMIHDMELKNSKKDKIKIIYYPSYIKPGDDLLNMSYDRFVSGIDIGCFPSRYEPWGYTPMESAAWRGISITSDLAGFGRFMEKENASGGGIKVLSIENGIFDEYTNQLADFFVELTSLSDQEINNLKKDAFEKMHLCTWKSRIKKYFKAYEKATGEKIK